MIPLYTATLQPCGVVFFLYKSKDMSETNVYVTQETFDKMREDLQKLKSVDRPAASRAIAEAREKGDLKENAEYDAAKEAQGMLESKIKQLEADRKKIETMMIESYRYGGLSDSEGRKIVPAKISKEGSITLQVTIPKE